MKYKELYESRSFNPGAYAVRALILFLREMFKSNTEFEYVVYDDDLNKDSAFRSLLITSKFEWEDKFRSKRPAITVSRGNVTTGINGTLGLGKVQSVLENGNVVFYTDLTSFPIVIDCLSESDVEAEVLSAIVLAFLSCDLRPIHSLGLQIQGSPSQTPAHIFEHGNISFVSSVIMQCQLQRHFKTKVISNQLLEKIKIELNSSMNISVT